jgi:lysophospholipase L1-like esterase
VFLCSTIRIASASTSFQEFDRRAKAGERLNVIFFGASLTWGANATDPGETSYRAQLAHRLDMAYPKAHFSYRDAAIGGTNSQICVFRLQRDVLSHHPDLVFLDFTANDDIYLDTPAPLAAYESLVRRIIVEGRCPLVQVIFPFESNIGAGEMARMKRREAHLAISRAYGTAVGDAVRLITDQVQGGHTTPKQLWPLDGTHPGDEGYALFAEAAWRGLRDGIDRRLVPAASEKMLFAPPYMKWNRARISTLGILPSGWKVGQTNRVSAWYDSLMSRWLDDEVILDYHPPRDGAGPAPVPASLRVKFHATTVQLLGEGTPKSGKYRAILDGRPLDRNGDPAKGNEFDAGELARLAGGNVRYTQTLITDLDPNIEHTLVIEPTFAANGEQELRLESICIAGGDATLAME